MNRFERPVADLHLHSNHSDGADPPKRVMERAAALGIAAVALTDHDTVSGVAEAAEAARGFGLEFTPGVEISAIHRGREMHVLGLAVDTINAALLDALGRQRLARERRAARIVEKLRGLGVLIDLERVKARAGGGSIGRIHIAQEVHAKGYTRSVQEVFDRFIKAKRQAYVPKSMLSIDETVELIHGAGGLASWAHPCLGVSLRDVARLAQLPFDGLEAYHTQHSAQQTEAVLSIAAEHGLLVTGGSDCHGPAKGEEPEMGKAYLPWERYKQLRKAITLRRGARD